MGDYTKLTNSQISEILKLYCDDELVSLRSLSLGISNSNYDVKTNKGHYLIKVSNDKNIDEVKEEMKILNHLSDHEFPHSLTPLTSKDNKSVYEYQDFYGVVFPFVQGIPPGPSDDTCFEIGAALAKLHKVKFKSEQLRPAKDVSFPPKVIFEFVNSDQCPEDFKNTFDSLIGDRANDYLNENFESGIIHGDLYYDNTLFDNNHLTYLLDFEQSGIGEFIFDLGISISGSCLEKSRISENLITSYLKGYESIRPLSDKEQEYLDLSIYWGLLSISLWRIKRFTTGNLNPYMKDSYKELLNRGLIFKLMRN